MMEAFLAEYGLSTAEGVGLMCLAEALLRVPDAETIDELIHDKIDASDWGAHLGRSSSPLVNASTWALMLTGKVLDDDPRRPAAAIRALADASGVPIAVEGVRTAWKLRGRQATGWPFVTWISRLKPDPLRALRLDQKKGELAPTTISRVFGICSRSRRYARRRYFSPFRFSGRPTKRMLCFPSLNSGNGSQGAAKCS